MNESKKRKMSRPDAWVTIVMHGDKYVPGAVVLATSLRCSGTRHVIACVRKLPNHKKKLTTIHIQHYVGL
jgi:hypothetical protein